MAKDKTESIIGLIKKGFTKREISKNLQVSEKVISKVVKDNGLKLTKAYSHGNDYIAEALKKLFPYILIEREHHVTSGLRIDVYIEQLKIGFEFDGDQHNVFNPYFHKDIDAFHKAQSLDKNKEYFSTKQGIKIVRFKTLPTDEELIKYVTDRIKDNP